MTNRSLLRYVKTGHSARNGDWSKWFADDLFWRSPRSEYDESRARRRFILLLKIWISLSHEFLFREICSFYWLCFTLLKINRMVWVERQHHRRLASERTRLSPIQLLWAIWISDSERWSDKTDIYVEMTVNNFCLPFLGQLNCCIDKAGELRNAMNDFRDDHNRSTTSGYSNESVSRPRLATKLGGAARLGPGQSLKKIRPNTITRRNHWAEESPN
jgi:hypothetical protein